MILRHITLQHVRNIEQASVALAGRRQFFAGANAQGKTNLLEAVGFLTALRSFRTSDARVLIAHGQEEAGLAFELGHERRAETRVVIRLRSGTKEVAVDGERVTRLGDYLGGFPTVVFSSQDQQLIRGAPGGRRRWLDLTLAATDPGYLRALQAYHRALAERSALLRRSASEGELAAFEHPLAVEGARLIGARRQGLEHLSAGLRAAFGRIVTDGEGREQAGFTYQPSFPEAETESLRRRLETGRARDRQFRTTLTGPHRDDFEFSVGGHAARDAASEGQQRALVLALKIAQAEWFQAGTGVAPLVLADDVLGELDPARRMRFWSALNPNWQVLATGTVLPEALGMDWQVFTVERGRFRLGKSGGGGTSAC